MLHLLEEARLCFGEIPGLMGILTHVAKRDRWQWETSIVMSP